MTPPVKGRDKKAEQRERLKMSVLDFISEDAQRLQKDNGGSGQTEIG